MFKPFKTFIFIPIFIYSLSYFVESTNDVEFNKFYKTYEGQYAQAYNKYAVAVWELGVDMNNDTKKEDVAECVVQMSQLKQKNWDQIKNFTNKSFTDPVITRLARFVVNDAKPGLKDDELRELTNLIANMTNKLANYKYSDCDWTCQEEDLKYAWKENRKLGVQIKGLFKRYVELSNNNARAKGYKDYGKMWMSSYDIENFSSYIDSLWKKLKPLSDRLYLFLRHCFSVDAKSLIPIHLFIGLQHRKRVWYPKDQFHPYDYIGVAFESLTITKNFHKMNKFVTSLGLLDNSKSFDPDEGATIEADYWYGMKTFCQPEAFDFGDQNTFKIRMCAVQQFESVENMAELLGEIQYFTQYKNLSFHLRNEPLNGFHEAIAGVIRLSATSVKHLARVGMFNLRSSSDYNKLNPETHVAILLYHVIRIVPKLGDMMVIDKWRLDVFSGAITEDQWNHRYWEYVEQYRYSKPPIKRVGKDDFDPGILPYIASDKKGMSYVLALILQYQIFKSLCVLAEQYNPKVRKDYPLHNCDFYGSTKVGDKLRAGMMLGRKADWRDVLEAMTGERDLDTTAILEYFEPFMVWSKAVILRTSLFFIILIFLNIYLIA